MVEQGYSAERAHHVAVARLKQERQAEQMQKRARSSSASQVIDVGHIVHLKTSPFDRARTDPTYATGIVVERKGVDAFVIANETGNIHGVHPRTSALSE